MTLTDRRKKILKEIAADKTTKEIASELNISTKTIEYHRKCLYVITNCNSAIGLTLWAIKKGIVSVEVEQNYNI